MSISYDQLREIDSTLTIVKGDASLFFSSIADLKSISENSLFFIKDKKFYNKWKSKSDLKAINASVLIEKKFYEKLSPEEIEELATVFQSISTVDNVPVAMSLMSEPFYHEKSHSWNDVVDSRQMGTSIIDPSADIAQNVFIGSNVSIGKNVKIYPGVVINSNSVIGDNTVLFANTTIYQNVKIGKNCRIHSSTVIGADGFGYNFHQGIHLKIWHMGGVIIGDNVEVGANSCIDQGTFSPTIIGNGTKIDNQCQVGHNCELGTGVIMCGHVAIGGSSKIGDYTVFGGKAAAGHDIELGKACQVAGACMVNSSWPDNSILGGHPARPLKEWLKGIAYLRKQSLGQ